MKVLMVPLDNRPVTYTLPQTIARVAGVEALVPPRQYLGSLHDSANVEAIFNWIDATLSGNKVEAIFVCADTLIYGGLINSRRSNESLKNLQSRIANMALWQRKAAGVPILVQSSIMRISDNHESTAEREYWSRYGREIFAWSANLHRLNGQGAIAVGVLRETEMRIPEEIRRDYMNARFRNYQVNSLLLDQLNKNVFSRLIYGLDDSGEYGLNVLEQEKLSVRIKQLNLSERALTYAGADEVLCSMFAYWLSAISRSTDDQADRSERANMPTAILQYTLPATEFCQSRYEGQSIGNSVRAQVKACGIKLLESDLERQQTPSFRIIIHAGEHGQGDHILLPGHQDLRSIDTREAVTSTLDLIARSSEPCILCDVAYANGADPILVEQLLERPDLLSKLYAYAGWNTSGNTIGSALALGIAAWFAGLNGRSSRALKEALYIRFADDWAYQTQVRRALTSAFAPHLQELLRPYLARIGDALAYKPERQSISFPWNRLFEVEIDTASAHAVAGHLVS